MTSPADPPLVSIPQHPDEHRPERALAATRVPNSDSWISVVSDANWRATDLDLMDMIDKAYWTSGNALAAERIDLARDRCETLSGSVNG